MSKLSSLLFFGAFLMSISCAKKLETSLDSNTSILPQPQSQVLHEGTFVLSSETFLEYDETFAQTAFYLKDFVEKGSPIRFRESEKTNKIIFTNDENIAHEEGYTLDIQSDAITISAKTQAGAFYAVQSLRQLLPENFENGTYPAKSVAVATMTIEDYPAFAYRGMHLDVCRHFFPVDFVKKYIDYLALLKMNTFHWHLTEDQGWRIEIKKYPELQNVAAWRDETLIGHYNEVPQRFDGTRYGGYYTQEEAREIVAYAAARHITVIPEIEMPGHAQAAIAAYPHLGCTGENPGVATLWGIFDDIFCPKEETFTFLEGVLDEILDIFPGTYIHIGGDEAPKTHWKNCSNCQAVIEREGLKDEDELQSYFITRIEKYLNSKGRQIIGWDEILEGGLAPNATVMSWRGTAGAVEAAKKGHKVVMTPNSHCYFDYYQSENEDEPLAIGGFVPLEKVYHFNPIPEGLTEEEASFVLGAQGNLWTEYIPDGKQVEYMIFPRITALSESVWTHAPEKDYLDFVRRLVVFLKRLDTLNVNYANHLYEVKGILKTDDTGSFYGLNTLLPNVDIRYTLDGSTPDLHATLYDQPILFNENKNIKAAVFDAQGQLGSLFVQELKYHKAVGKSITFNVDPHPSYSGGGKSSLINGIQGNNKRFGDKDWLGFWGDDIEITIDLGKKTEINLVKTRFYHAPGQWIYAPKEVRVELRDENKEVIVSAVSELKNKEEFPLQKFIESTVNLQARFVVIKAKNYGIIPEGAQGAGHKAWTFIDEIVVE